MTRHPLIPLVMLLAVSHASAQDPVQLFRKFKDAIDQDSRPQPTRPAQSTPATPPQQSSPANQPESKQSQGAQIAQRAYSDADIEEAWNCAPDIAFDDLDFNNPRCSPSAMPDQQRRRLLDALRSKYLRKQPNGRTDYTLFGQERDRRDKIMNEQYRAQEKRRAEEKERQAVLLQDRQVKLKSGAMKPENTLDVALLYHERGLEQLMISPLLSPDSQVYSGIVVIDQQEKENLLRVRLPMSQPVYAWLRTGSNTRNFAPSLMRIGASIVVAGRYVANVKYRTVVGEQRTAPTIDTMYIGDPDQLK